MRAEVVVSDRAEPLRRAAAEIRSVHDSPSRTAYDDFALAVADWLAACALVLDVKADAAQAHALRVARAYLMDDAPTCTIADASLCHCGQVRKAGGVCVEGIRPGADDEEGLE